MSSVSGKLSSRVMNMKFMRFSKDDSDADNTSSSTRENTPVESQGSSGANNYHDNSEWFASASTSSDKKKITIKKKKTMSRAVVSQNVSITTLRKGHQVANDGRQTYTKEGDKKHALEDETAEEEAKDDYDLDRMFKEDLKKRRTNNTKSKSKSTTKSTTNSSKKQHI